MAENKVSESSLKFLADTLRQYDYLELVENADKEDAVSAIKDLIKDSDKYYYCEKDGKPIYICGYSKDICNSCVFWLLSTVFVNDMPVYYGKSIKSVINAIMKEFDILYTYIRYNYSKAKKAAEKAFGMKPLFSVSNKKGKAETVYFLIKDKIYE